MSGNKKSAAPVQKTTMLSFFGKPKAPATTTNSAATPSTGAAPTAAAATSTGPAPSVAANFFGSTSATSLALPSKTAAAAASDAAAAGLPVRTPVKPTPVSASAASATTSPNTSSPSFSLSASGRKRKSISYKESGDEASDDDETTPVKKPIASISKKPKKGKGSDDDEDYAAQASSASEAEEVDDDDFVDDDDDDCGYKSKKPSSSSKKSSSSSAKKSAPAKKAAVSSSYDDDTPADEPRGGSKEYSTPWLLPENRRDLNQRRITDPGYDPATLYIPTDAWKKFTPAETQYWEIKQRNCDLVLFFKIGKFYEMFDEDAEVGVKELGLAYMVNQKRPHAGFPEAALPKYAEQLVRLGYKIGQVDQTETPEELKAANAKLKPGMKKRSAVRREMSQLLTPGTLVDSEVLKSDFANYLFALVERELSFEEIAAQREEQAQEHAASIHAEFEDQNVFVVEYGFSYVDCCTGRFYIGQHRDDKQRSFLKTLLGFVSPKEILVPRGKLSVDTQQVLKYELRTDVCMNEIEQDKEFWNANKTIEEINKAQYFVNVKTEANVESAAGSNGQQLPSALQHLVDDSQTLALSSFGALVWYLRRTMHDMELLSLGNISLYFHAIEQEDNRCLALDGQTLNNLEIVRGQDGTTKGTLLEFVNRAVTAFAKRKIREWVTRPLFAVKAIKARQDAVAFFMQEQDLSDSLRKAMKALPDLERSLSRIHANGLKKSMNVVMYTDVDAKKLDLFLSTLQGFDHCNRIFQQLQPYVDDVNSNIGSRLRYLLTPQAAGGFLPDFMPALASIRTSFDSKLAASTHKIKPNPGLNEDYDRALDKLNALKQESEKYLVDLRRQFGDSSIKYMHKNKERYQIEISVKALAKGVPSGFQLMSSSKTVQRFWTDRSREYATKISELELEVEAHEKDMSRAVFAKFAESYQLWIGAVEAMSEVDCLLSLALISKYHAGCIRPTFVEFELNDCKSKLELRGAKHPCLYESDTTNLMHRSSQVFIENDTVIGCEENPTRFVLVSGPNMGGKSTLLRQTCCNVILAQIGCWVPAEKCELTPIDRIFTRVGANDKIMQGQSTFLVELMETSVILKNASNRSLVILDELGRGTSTFDGTAIAHAVIEHLSQNVDCLTLFATHYHMLMDEFMEDPRISMYHMACQVNDDAAEADVTFLYKFIKGVCPKSYGNNVARAAGLPESIILCAKEMSESFEKRCVEAMGKNRSNLMSTFPQQKSSTFMLPSTTIESMMANLKLALTSDEALDKLIDMQERFTSTELLYEKKRQQVEQQQARMQDL